MLMTTAWGKFNLKERNTENIIFTGRLWQPLPKPNRLGGVFVCAASIHGRTQFCNVYPLSIRPTEAQGCNVAGMNPVEPELSSPA
jgi:hypothetical protein